MKEEEREKIERENARSLIFSEMLTIQRMEVIL